MSSNLYCDLNPGLIVRIHVVASWYRDIQNELELKSEPRARCFVSCANLKHLYQAKAPINENILWVLTED